MSSLVVNGLKAIKSPFKSQEASFFNSVALT